MSAGGIPIRFLLAACSIVLSACGDAAVIEVIPTERHQTIDGWDSGAQIGQEVDMTPALRDTIMALAFDVIGVDGLRVGVRSGIEHPTDNYALYRSGEMEYADYRCIRYATVNDNEDPHVIDWSGFNFSHLDETMEQVVAPWAGVLAERGRELRLSMTYVAMTYQICDGDYIHADDPEEYAEFVLATFLHLRDRYDIVPDSWEVMLEPDRATEWPGEVVGEALVAAARRLREAGFEPEFIGPSSSDAPSSIRDFDAMMEVEGAAGLLDELAYHRYADSTRISELEALAERAERYGLRTAMLEHVTGNVDELHDDLVYANVSNWVQAVIAYPGIPDNGAQLITYELDGDSFSNIEISERAKLLTQYFRFIDEGAQRLGATSTDERFAPVAFENPDGSTVVVVRARSGRPFRVGGLPPGRYEVTFSNESDFLADGGSFDLLDGGEISVRVPGGGVATIVSSP